jgi:hypothetical protein
MPIEFPWAAAMPLVAITIGAILLLTGRHLFWLLVASIGFWLGWRLAWLLTGGDSQWVSLILALGGALMGALAAVLAQRVALWAAGLLFGGVVVLIAWEHLGNPPAAVLWPSTAAGALVGAFLFSRIFDAALIFFSAAFGAAMICQTLPLNRNIQLVIFFMLYVVGIGVQLYRRGAQGMLPYKDPNDH